MSDIFIGRALSLLDRMTVRIHICNTLKQYGVLKECSVYFFVVLAKASTFTDGLIPEGGITVCTVNQY